MSDKKEIPYSRLDWKSRNNRHMDNEWGEIKEMITKSEMGEDGTGCMDRHYDNKLTVADHMWKKKRIEWDGLR